MSKTTPCIEKGYRVGDRFRVTNRDAVFAVGSIIELQRDDSSDSPLFRLVTGECQYNNAWLDGKKVPGAYECLHYVTKIEEAPVTKFIIAVSGTDITEGREYPIYNRGAHEYFKDDVGHERLVSVQLRRGARYASTDPISHDRHGFKPGDRVECTKHRAFQGKVHYGCRGTVVGPRDPGVNVKWDNGFSVRDGTATISPANVRKVTDERVTPWSTAPEWATHYGIEPSGRHYWFNLPPIELNKHEFRRGLDSRHGNKHHEIEPKLPDHNGKFYVEARPVTKPEVTPQSEAKYLVRVLKCQNDLIHGSFVKSYRPGGAGFSGDVHNKTDRTDAKRFTYEEVTEFLRNRAEQNKDEDFEVILDYIKTGAVVAPPERGNNGWTVGTRLRCDLSGHPDLHPGNFYVVTRFDGDGDEVLRGEFGDEVLAKYGQSERNEYTVVSEGK